jgi:Zn-dependent protease with chaperone function
VNYVPKPDSENFNVSKENHLTNLAVLVVGFLVLLTIFVFSFAKIAEYFLVKMSPETEKRIFAPLTPEAIFKTNIIRPWDEGQRILKKLEPDLDFQVFILCDEQANAFAFPGNRIFVTSGLVEKIQSENGLAFVLAHELGHFKNRDHLRGLGAAVGVISAGLILGIDSTFANFGNVSTSLVTRAFSRDQEEQADDFATSLMQKSYGGLTGVQEFFADLSKEESLASKMPKMFSTHPKTQDRLQKLNQKIAAVSPVETSPLDKSGVSCDLPLLELDQSEEPAE